MKKLYFKFMHKLIGKSVSLVSKINMPWVTKKIEYADVDLIQKCYLKEGDIILTRTNGWLSTIAMPGFWRHVAIYIEDGYIIDATTTHGVSVRYLADLCLKADNFVVLRYKDLKEFEVKRGVGYLYKNEMRKKYDFEMDLLDDVVRFCTELAMIFINKCKGSEVIKYTETLEIPMLAPQAFYDNKDQFDIIFEKRS